MLRAAWRFRQFLKRFAPAFGAGAVLVGLGTLVDLAQPWPLKVIVDGAFLHRPQTGWLPALIAGPTPSPNVWNGTSWMITTSPQTILVRAAFATALLAALGAVFDYSSDMLMDRAGEKVVVKLRRATYAHLQRLSISFHERQRVGDLVSRVTNDIDRVQSMLVSVFDTLIPSVVMLLGITVVVLVVNPSFGLLALAIAPPLFFVTYRYTRRIRDAARRAREADAQVAAHANETLGAVRSIQAFTREDHEDRRFEEANLESLAASLESVRLRAMFTPIVDIVSVAGTLIVTYFGAERVIHGKMSLGIFLVFLFYLRQLYRPMRALSKMSYVVSRGTTSAARVEEILRVDERIPQREGAIHLDRATGAIDLVDVTFRYRPDLPPVLEHATVNIAPGERIGIVGRTGAGKSTIASLISRFYDPEAGAVLIDGVDVRDFELASLRQQVSIVLQEPVLFFGSILDNIRYGDVDAPMERVWDCVEAAHVSDFLDRLPGGIDTMVSERGTTLSGGQRQRIAIARAMLADAPILILDEPTTGLDRKSEGLVLDGLERLSKGRTTIVISHHEPALRGVSRLIHVIDGRLVEGDVPIEEAPAARTESDRFELTLDAAADEVDEHTFSRVPDGYAVHEVDGFLSRLSARLRASSRRERALLQAALEARGLGVRGAEDLPAFEDPADGLAPEEPAGRRQR
jgi:ATP-binding cassette, subfamily B, bacterial